MSIKNSSDRRYTNSSQARTAAYKIVIIGNGMAGLRVAEHLAQSDSGQCKITMFAAEQHLSYNRIMLSPVLSGEKRFDDICTRPLQWYESHNIHLHLGDPVVAIDRHRQTVTSESGQQQSYDRLILATGSNPFMVPVPGVDLDGVISFRDIQDVDRMVGACTAGRRAVVIGGGLLGLEAAYGLHQRGLDVTVVHLMDQLMERQLDDKAATLLRHSLIQRGLSFYMAAQTTAIHGDDQGRVVGLSFKGDDHPSLDADLVIMAVGIRPNIQLAQDAGLACNKGIVVDDSLRTSDHAIHAVGECIEHRGAVYGLVAPAWEQAAICARHVATPTPTATATAIPLYSGSVTATQLKVTGVSLYSAGDFHGDDTTEIVTYEDSARGIYKKLVLRDNRIIGIVLYGDTRDGAWYFQLMQAETDVSLTRSSLIHGQAFVAQQHLEAA